MTMEQKEMIEFSEIFWLGCLDDEIERQIRLG